MKIEISDKIEGFVCNVCGNSDVNKFHLFNRRKELFVKCDTCGEEYYFHSVIERAIQKRVGLSMLLE